MAVAPVAAPGRRLLALALLFDLGALVCTVGQVAALARVVEPALLERRGLDAAATPAALLIALTLLRSTCLGAREIVGQAGASRVRATTRRAALDRLIALGPCGLGHESRGELLAFLGQGLERLDSWIARYLPQRALTVLGPLAIAAYVWWLDPLSGILMLLSAPAVPVLMLAVGSYAEESTREQWAALTHLSAALLDSIQGLPTLKLFGQEIEEAEQLNARSQTFRVSTMGVLRKAFLSSFLLELLTTAAIAVLAVELGLRLLNGGLSFVATLQIVLLAPEFYRPMRELGTQRHAAMEAQPVRERLAVLLKMPARPTPPRATLLPPPASAAIALVDVSYTYPGPAETPALDHVSLSLSRGTRTAVVGPSGAGKTTLINLLLRFLEPDDGMIYANGAPIQSLTPEGWRERAALVPQRPYLFDASVLDNLRIADPRAPMEALVHAAELAGAHEFVRSLPNGYHTPLGQRGARLSQGQAQRIAIARAFLKDAPLLILDEPTSALDPESERLVRRSLEVLQRHRTVLVVAHRLNTVCTSDQVVVLQHGVIVERGTHAELIERAGLYAALVGASARMTVAA